MHRVHLSCASSACAYSCTARILASGALALACSPAQQLPALRRCLAEICYCSSPQDALKLSDGQTLELLEVTRLFEADKARLEAAQQQTLANLHVRPLHPSTDWETSRAQA